MPLDMPSVPGMFETGLSNVEEVDEEEDEEDEDEEGDEDQDDDDMEQVPAEQVPAEQPSGTQLQSHGGSQSHETAVGSDEPVNTAEHSAVPEHKP
jgi:hypothetical protein